jgi:virulence factor Mce-like protein
MKLRRTRHAPRLIPIGIATIFAALLAGYVAISGRIPFTPDAEQTTTVEFANAANAYPGNPVRIGGIQVGTISSVRLDSGYHALVELRIDRGIVLHRDARVALRWRTLFGGNMYIDLDPGTPGSPLLADRRIPLSQTSSQVEFDQLLTSLRAPARTAVQDVFQQGAGALANPGPAAAAIEALAPTTGALAEGLAGLRGSAPGDLTRLVSGAQRTLAGLADSERNLAGLIDSAALSLGVTAAHQGDLQGLLERAPGALGQTSLTMARLRRTLGLLDPLVESLRPGARALLPAEHAAVPALGDLDPLLHDLRPVLAGLSLALPELAVAARHGLPVIAGLEQTASRLRTSVIPFLAAVDHATGLANYAAIGPMLASLDSMSSEFDGLGHMFRYEVGGGEATLNPTACQLVMTPTSADKQACAQLLTTLTDLLSGRHG